MLSLILQSKLAAMHPKERLPVLPTSNSAFRHRDFFVTREIPIWGLMCTFW